MGSSHGGSRHRASAEHSADKAGERTSSAARPAQSDSRDWQHNDQDKAMDALVGKNYSKRREFKYCARKFATLQDRLAKMEAYVTSSQFRLHRKFKNI
jgi:hypothetical protein